MEAKKIELTSSLAARIERVEKFFMAFYKAIGKPYHGDNSVPVGNWTDGCDTDGIKRLFGEFSFDDIATAASSLHVFRTLVHEALATGNPVKGAMLQKRVLFALRVLLRRETKLVKDSPTSVLALRLLDAGVIEKRRDRNTVDTFYDIYDKTFEEAMDVLSFQFGEKVAEKAAEKGARE